MRMSSLQHILCIGLSLARLVLFCTAVSNCSMPGLATDQPIFAAGADVRARVLKGLAYVRACVCVCDRSLLLPRSCCWCCCWLSVMVVVVVPVGVRGTAVLTCCAVCAVHKKTYTRARERSRSGGRRVRVRAAQSDERSTVAKPAARRRGIAAIAAVAYLFVNTLFLG